MYTQLQNLLRKNRPTKIMQTSFFGHALGSFCNTFANFCLAPIGSLNMYTQYQNLLQKNSSNKIMQSSFLAMLSEAFATLLRTSPLFCLAPLEF